MKRKTTHQNDSQSSDATDSSNKRSKNFEQLEKKHVRNPGIPLDMAWVNEAKVNCPAVKRRVASHSKRRCVKKGTQLGWLLRTISLIDLTTLGGMDSESNVNRLCAKAKTPLIADYVKALELENKNVKVGAVCVYPNRVAEAVKALEGSGIGVASVAAGFPAGQTPLDLRLTEIERAVAAGASEIDIVLSRNLVLQGKWEEVYSEVVQMRKACGHAHLKTILATGEHPTLRDVYKSSLVCMMAGADFIKTSTGKEKTNATLEVGLVMIRAIRDFHERTGFQVGFKPAGGISNAKLALSWLSLMYEELGSEWTYPHLFRIGASSLLTDVERQIGHGISGKYAAKYYLPKP